MTDLTPTLNTLLPPSSHLTTRPSKTADEFLKEAYRINTHITNLITYLQAIRKPYLTPTPARPHTTKPQSQSQSQQYLTDTARDNIDTSTSTLLHDLSTSISTLSSAESLRQETRSSILNSRYGRSSTASALLFRWAAGGGGGNGAEEEEKRKKPEQVRDEEEERVTSAVRESVLWYLRRGLEGAVERQRELVERRVERVREKERSVLYKHVSGSGSGGQQHLGGTGGGLDVMMMAEEEGKGSGSREEEDDIKNQLSAEQLQLFEDENQSMLRYYEDTLSKVRHAEKSLLDISSLQQSLVSHLATQEDFIGQLVTDAGTTQTNIGGGNKELKRATESRSTAQAVFWGTVGLCTWLVVWDLVF